MSMIGGVESAIAVANWITPVLSVVSAFGAAYATSLLADRILKREMGNFTRGIFTFVIGNVL
jgi:hypothetical protein